MAINIKQLIEKNKSAYRKQFFIESVNLSYVLSLKALREIIKEENIEVPADTKLNDCLKILKKQYEENPLFKTKLKRSVYKSLSTFSEDYKLISKSLKTQYPALKLKHTARAGLDNIVMLNTALIRLKSNKAKF